MHTTLVVFALVLLVLTLLSAFGGSIRYTEPFYDDAAVSGQNAPLKVPAPTNVPQPSETAVHEKKDETATKEDEPKEKFTDNEVPEEDIEPFTCASFSCTAAPVV